MKKTFVIVFFLSFSYITLIAQSQIGFKGGYSRSDFFYKPVNYCYYSAEFKADHGYLASLYYKMGIDKKYKIGFELEYKLKSFDYHSFTGSIQSATNIHAHYDLYFIYFAILPEFSMGKKFKIFINGGPYAGSVVNTNVKGGGSYWMDLPHFETRHWTLDNKTTQFSGLDVGIKCNLGTNIYISKKISLLLEGQYGIGLRDITTGNLARLAKFINSRDKSVSLGLMFDIGNPGNKDQSKISHCISSFKQSIGTFNSRRKDKLKRIFCIPKILIFNPDLK